MSIRIDKDYIMKSACNVCGSRHKKRMDMVSDNKPFGFSIVCCECGYITNFATDQSTGALGAFAVGSGTTPDSADVSCACNEYDKGTCTDYSCMCRGTCGNDMVQPAMPAKPPAVEVKPEWTYPTHVPYDPEPNADQMKSVLQQYPDPANSIPFTPAPSYTDGPSLDGDEDFRYESENAPEEEKPSFASMTNALLSAAKKNLSQGEQMPSIDPMNPVPQQPVEVASGPVIAGGYRPKSNHPGYQMPRQRPAERMHPPVKPKNTMRDITGLDGQKYN